MNEQRNLRRLRRVARSLDKHKILPQDAVALHNELARISHAIAKGVRSQRRAEKLHAEWEAIYGPDLTDMH